MWFVRVGLFVSCVVGVWSASAGEVHGRSFFVVASPTPMISGVFNPRPLTLGQLSHPEHENSHPAEQFGVLRSPMNGLFTIYSIVLVSFVGAHLLVGCIFGGWSLAKDKRRLVWGIYNLVWSPISTAVGLYFLVLGGLTLGLPLLLMGLVGISLGIAGVVQYHRKPRYNGYLPPQDSPTRRVWRAATTGLSFAF